MVAHVSNPSHPWYMKTIQADGTLWTSTHSQLRGGQNLELLSYELYAMKEEHVCALVPIDMQAFCVLL